MTAHSNGVRVWLGVALTFVLAASGWVYSAGSLSTKVAQNTKTNDAQEARYVPRTEIDAKLENIELQVGAVQQSVDAYAAQSERQAQEIIRRIERLPQPRRTQ